MKHLISKLIKGKGLLAKIKHGRKEHSSASQFIMETQMTYDEWILKKCPLPPPHIVKQKAIREYKEKYGYRVFVETGTYMGDMVEALKNEFKKVISIELSEELYSQAVERFIKDMNVEIINGDSGLILSNIIEKINEPAIFWLDGHYSGGITAKGEKVCPIYEELNAILEQKHFKHIILIDDARLFGVNKEYPDIDSLTAFIKQTGAIYHVDVKHDIIRYLPNIND